MEDVKLASVIVVGRLANYEVMANARDPVAAHQRDKLLREALVATPEQLKRIAQQNQFLSDFARFDIEVDEVLFGDAPKMLSVTWDNSTFSEPKTMPAGPFLVALRDPKSPIPALRGPSAAIMPAPLPNMLTVLQAPCGRAFIFKGDSAEAAAIRKLVEGSEK